MYYFRHYERCISNSFTVKDNGEWNYLRFISDFVQGPRCSPESPFRLAVLAWTAKHLAVTSQPNDSAWKAYYDRAMTGLERLEARGDVIIPPGSPAASPSTSGSILGSAAEVIICSTLFLCRCDVLNDDLQSVVNHLNNLKERLGHYLNGTALSSFASKILLWLCYLHVRISIFSTSPTETTPATTLLDTLLDRPEYEQIYKRSHMYLSEIFGESYPKKNSPRIRRKFPHR